jgi:hypothetical protein
MITGYKWTRPDGMSWHDATFGPYAAGKTLTVPGAVVGDPCGIGLHVSARVEDAVGYGRFPGSLWVVESDGPVLGQDSTKMRVASLRVVAEVVKPVWVVAVETFLASIAEVPWFKPTGPPDPTWEHFANYASARASAWDSTSARDRARASTSVWASVWASAWDSARTSASASARANAWARARASASANARASASASVWANTSASARDSAALMGAMACLCDCDVPAEHRAHAAARWDVWQRGYGLVCDVDGVLYTYGEWRQR